jgi:hypothetical protein
MAAPPAAHKLAAATIFTPVPPAFPTVANLMVAVNLVIALVAKCRLMLVAVLLDQLLLPVLEVGFQTNRQYAMTELTVLFVAESVVQAST